MPWPFVPPDPDKPPTDSVVAWTRAPFESLGDKLDAPAPVRKVVALKPLGDHYALVRLPDGSTTKVKRTALCKSAEACG